MSESNTTPAAPSGFRKFLRALLRLVLFGLVTAVIITVVYLGVVYMLQNAVQPARVNA
jgi:hypothetical protein